MRYLGKVDEVMVKYSSVSYVHVSIHTQKSEITDLSVTIKIKWNLVCIFSSPHQRTPGYSLIDCSESLWCNIDRFLYAHLETGRIICPHRFLHDNFSSVYWIFTNLAT